TVVRSITGPARVLPAIPPMTFCTAALAPTIAHAHQQSPTPTARPLASDPLARGSAKPVGGTSIDNTATDARSRHFHAMRAWSPSRAQTDLGLDKFEPGSGLDQCAIEEPGNRTHDDSSGDHSHSLTPSLHGTAGRVFFPSSV